ncbi:poly(A)-specific ribonuclease [Malassezia cuniculi]|uniref:CCR4-Not complex 3'-5'-exoribonuclease subunit Ccr4 n=1 Tax=Malassezia cuniculi TaxID=948313 RepID=A0AAF0ERW7_9BASI|nr:poly(A)-specific ribonuclease [Malassezia cuniculi]
MSQSPHNAPMLRGSVSPATPRDSLPGSADTSMTGAGPEWQRQLMCAEISRKSYAPHHHARAAALAARSSVDSGKGIQLPAGAAANGLSFPTRDSEEKPKGSEGQSWTIIDMGGLNLPTIGVDVFRYTFLTSLFINHNRLTTISPAIVQLKNLSVLDASGNKLVAIPPELGMLTELRELYLFDNHLTVLPPELGSLYQLELLGVEGNPLQENIMSTLQRDGTQALIAFLRDSCPVPVPPPEREWLALENDLPPVEDDGGNNTFSVLSYNVLCEKYATAQMYGYTPSWALAWNYRKEFILQEIMSYAADVCCLQEVEMGQYEEYFLPKLQQNEYESVFWPKTRARTMREDERQHVDGCATFFNSRIFRLVDKRLIEFNQIALQRPDFKKTEDIFNRVMTKDNIAAIVLLEHRTTGARLIVANAHMHWDPEFRDVKLVQAAMLMEQLEEISETFSKLPPGQLPDGSTPPKYSSRNQIPMVVCGDFNSTPDSGVYEFLSQGSAPNNHRDFMDHIYGNYTSDGLRHSFALRSAYGNIGELPFTNYTPGFRGVIDYIWYTSNSLAASGILGTVDQTYLSRTVGFPNAHFPSDHVCILAEFKIKPT